MLLLKSNYLSVSGNIDENHPKRAVSFQELNFRGVCSPAATNQDYRGELSVLYTSSLIRRPTWVSHVKQAQCACYTTSAIVTLAEHDQHEDLSV